MNIGNRARLRIDSITSISYVPYYDDVRNISLFDRGPILMQLDLLSVDSSSRSMMIAIQILVMKIQGMFDCRTLVETQEEGGDK